MNLRAFRFKKLNSDTIFISVSINDYGLQLKKTQNSVPNEVTINESNKKKKIFDKEMLSCGIPHNHEEHS